MSDQERAAMNVIVTRELKDRIDAMSFHTGIPNVRIVESLLRDDLGLPPLFPGLADHLRELTEQAG